jgi:uncharacterized membrane protein
VYDLSVTIHVVAALVGFGVTYSYPVLQLLGERGDRRHLPFALDAIATISRQVAVPATTIVGITGVYQLADGPYGLGDAWAAAGLVLYLAVMAVATGYLAPRYGRAADAARRNDQAEYAALIRGVNVLGAFVVVAVLAVVVLMVLKPG